MRVRCYADQRVPDASIERIGEPEYLRGSRKYHRDEGRQYS